MLIIALILAVIGLAALVFAVVTSNALVAWVCIGASVLGVLLLIMDALAERRRQRPAEPADDAEPAPESEEAAGDTPADTVEGTYQNFDTEYPDESAADESAADADDDAPAGQSAEQVDDTTVSDDQNAR